MEKAQWKKPEDVKKAHPKASILKGSRVVFNVKGNDYRTEAYERSRWPRRVPSLPDLLSYLMDQHGLSRSDLIPLLGTASRVSEVMTGKRELSMTMVRKLRERFHIPADLLIPPLRSSEIAA